MHDEGMHESRSRIMYQDFTFVGVDDYIPPLIGVLSRTAIVVLSGRDFVLSAVGSRFLIIGGLFAFPL